MDNNLTQLLIESQPQSAVLLYSLVLTFSLSTCVGICSFLLANCGFLHSVHILSRVKEDIEKLLKIERLKIERNG